MSIEGSFNYKINGNNITCAIKKVYDIVEKNKETSNVFVCFDNSLGSVLYTIIDNEIKISFSSLKIDFVILRYPVHMIDEKIKKIGLLYWQKKI